VQAEWNTAFAAAGFGGLLVDEAIFWLMAGSAAGSLSSVAETSRS
jgi:hypothetical protein